MSSSGQFEKQHLAPYGLPQTEEFTEEGYRFQGYIDPSDFIERVRRQPEDCSEPAQDVLHPEDIPLQIKDALQLLKEGL